MVKSRAYLVFACLAIAFLSSFLIIRHATVVTLAATQQPDKPSNGAPEAAVVKHAPTINSGRIAGSVRQLTGENVSLSGISTITSDLFVPGTPKVQLNGKSSFSGIVEGTGSALPSGYQITLSGNAVLGRIITRTNPVQLVSVPAPPAPLGTRDVTLTNTGGSVGDFTTLRDLTIKELAGNVAVPPGSYRRFTAEGNTSFVFGTANSTLPAVYYLEELSLNSGSRLQLVGPVAITIKNKVTINGGSSMGEKNIPLWLQLKIAGVGASIVGNSTLYGIVNAPVGTISLDGGSLLRGVVYSDRIVISGNSALEGIATDTSPPAITIEQPLENAVITESYVKVNGTVTDESATIVTVNGILADTNGLEFATDVPLELGENILTVIAVDVFGNTSQADRKVIRKINLPPTADAGADQTIYLPDAANLNGIAADDGLPAGSTLTVAWSKLSGPGSVVFSNAQSASTTASFSLAGTYVLKMTASDGSLSADDDITITVIPPNQPPTVNAGIDQTITLPSSASLSGTVSDDGLPLGSTLTITWSKSSGPGTVTFSNSHSASTTASFSLAGTYVLKLTASDGPLSADDDVAITVIPQNQAPTVNAGADQSITLPNTASLDGTVSDDGLPLGSTLFVTWSKLSGPGIVTFSNSHSASTTASFSLAGTYVLKLTASDGDLSADDDVAITVIPQNQPPTVNAGTDQTITLPSSASLDGTVTDDGLPAGSTLTVTWSKSSGPGTVTFSNSHSASTTASFSLAGTYVLKLTASDGPLSADDDVSITVIPQNQPPTVNAGTDQTITLPNTASLDGTVSDDGLPLGSTLTITWSKSSGPGTVTFSNSHSASTTASFSLAGTYVLKLTASDGPLSADDDVAITVIPQNQAPTVNAGADQSITLPNTASLDGTVSDDGLPLGSTLFVTWSKLSGPGIVTFSNSHSASTTASFSLAGTYVLKLTASDGDLSADDDVAITVIPQNQAPTVNAGADQTITLPDSASLSGTASDDGQPLGSTLTVTWSKLSGPGAVVFGDAHSTSTTASFSLAGTYVLRLTASDGALSADDDVTITVTPQNQAPTVNAGADQTITLPALASLSGTASDDGLPLGSTLTVTWSKLSGLGTVVFANAHSASTAASFSLAGTYVLRLTASDGALSTADDVTITVIPQNQPPTVNAGADQTITLPSSASLSGTVADDGLPAGSTLTIAWSKLSGPGTVVFSNPNQTATTASFDQAGSYILRLSADDTQFVVSDDVVVTVKAPKVAQYLTPIPYLSVNNSPFRLDSCFALETFEDGIFNLIGVTANAGPFVLGPGFNTDSVDGDDLVIDGNGQAGHSFFSLNGNAGITFIFNPAVIGFVPTKVGVVWTDGAGDVFFEAFDGNGVSMGLSGPFNFPDRFVTGETAEDRFLGVINSDGISKIKIYNTIGGIEVDHLQYSADCP